MRERETERESVSDISILKVYAFVCVGRRVESMFCLCCVVSMKGNMNMIRSETRENHRVCACLLCVCERESVCVFLLTLLVGSCLGESIRFEIQSFVRFGEPLHARVTNHDINSLFETPKDVLLDIGDSVTTANRFHLRS